MKTLAKLNKWYDRLREPWRFLGMIVLTWPPIILIYTDVSFWAKTAGFCFLILLVAIRSIHLHGPKHETRNNQH